MDAEPGLHLVSDAERVDAVDALAARWAGAGGGRVGLEGLLGDLRRRGRRSWLPLRGGTRVWTWEAADRRDDRWWPQGVATAVDATPGPDGGPGLGDLVVVAWYAKQRPGDPDGGQGVRLSFFDVARRRYEHVLVVRVPEADGRAGTAPLHAHAGGLVWVGPWLHVAATARGFWSVRADDVLRVPDGEVAAHHGYRYVLPVRQRHRAGATDGVERLRYSFFSVDRDDDGARGGPALVVGEYGRGRRTRRIARFPLDVGSGLPVADDDGRARPVVGQGVAGMQGVVVVGGTHLVSTSHGARGPGSLWTGDPGAQHGWHRHRWALPMGPEDLAHGVRADEVWTATEHPRRRWLVRVRASGWT